MEILSNLAMGFGVALTPFTLFLAVVGCFLGTIIGALPGLGPSNGVAILIPLAFSLGLDATQALVLLTSVYYGTMYGGRISSILLNIPGDEPAMMTTLDGYPMAKQGRAGDALVISGVASFVGAFIATIGLVIIGALAGADRLQVRSGRVFRALSAGLHDAGRRGVEEPGQGGFRGLPGPGHRHDRHGQFNRHAALYRRQSAPDGRGGFPGRHRRPVRHRRGVLFHRKPWQEQRHRRQAGQGDDPLERPQGDDRHHAARHRHRLCRRGSARRRGFAGVVHGLYGGEILHRFEGQFRQGRPARRGRAGGGQQRRGWWRDDPDADAGRAGVWHDGGDAGAADDAEHHPRPAACSPNSRKSSGA